MEALVMKCFMVEKIGETVEQCADGGSVTRPIYRLPDGSKVSFEGLPIGAMFAKENGAIVTCIPQVPDWSRKTFFSTAETYSGSRWAMTGEPPNITDWGDRQRMRLAREHKTPWPDTAKLRNCLKCGQEFMSESNANRLCSRCNLSNHADASAIRTMHDPNEARMLRKAVESS
jgi:hypothetical protein